MKIKKMKKIYNITIIFLILISIVIPLVLAEGRPPYTAYVEVKETPYEKSLSRVSAFNYRVGIENIIYRLRIEELSYLDQKVILSITSYPIKYLPDFKSVTINKTLEVGEEKGFDTNEDKKDDVKIKLLGVWKDSIKFSIRLAEKEEEIPPPIIVVENKTNITEVEEEEVVLPTTDIKGEGDEKKESTSSWWVVLVIIGIIVIVLTIYFVIKNAEKTKRTIVIKKGNKKERIKF